MQAASQIVTATSSLHLAGDIGLSAVLLACDVGHSPSAPAASVELALVEAQSHQRATLIAAEVDGAATAVVSRSTMAAEDVLGSAVVAVEMSGPPGQRGVDGARGEKGEPGVAGPAGPAQAIPPLQELGGLLAPGQVDQRGLSVLGPDGSPVVLPSGLIGPQAFMNLNGSNILLSDVAARALAPSLAYVGEMPQHPTPESLGAGWQQNAIYRNSADGVSYILTGQPLAWEVYMPANSSFALVVESSRGTVFRPGEPGVTMLAARLFKNGAEVTDATPANWFRWRRSSFYPQAPPNDDATWNQAYSVGFKQVQVPFNTPTSRATYFCDIVSF